MTRGRRALRVREADSSGRAAASMTLPAQTAACYAAAGRPAENTGSARWRGPPYRYSISIGFDAAGSMSMIVDSIDREYYPMNMSLRQSRFATVCYSYVRVTQALRESVAYATAAVGVC